MELNTTDFNKILKNQLLNSDIEEKNQAVSSKPEKVSIV